MSSSGGISPCLVSYGSTGSFELLRKPVESSTYIRFLSAMVSATPYDSNGMSRVRSYCLAGIHTVWEIIQSIVSLWFFPLLNSIQLTSFCGLPFFLFLAP